MLYLLIVTYVLGGLTLLPLLALAAAAYAFYDSVAVPPRHPIVANGNADDDADNNDDTATNTAVASPPLKAWLTVRHTFAPSPSSYISLVRTLLDTRSTRRTEDAFYAVLKRAVLYLYEDDALSECAAAIDVRQCDVRIVAGDDNDDGTAQPLLDGELFARRNAVLLRERATSGSVTPQPDPLASASSTTADPRAWYIFFPTAPDMEDWYFALLAQHPPAPFPHAAQRALIDALDALPDRIPTRWLNALLGRLFLGLKGTTMFREWVIGRLMRKLGKVKTPTWLTSVVVRNFDAGDVPPVFSKPMLKELTPEGAASVGVDVSYIAPQSGGIRITLSATASIALPSMLSFKSKSSASGSGANANTKENMTDVPLPSQPSQSQQQPQQPSQPYEVSLVLAVVVRRVEGTLLFKVKPPPSSRVWYAFTTPPRIDIEVVPVVGFGVGDAGKKGEAGKKGGGDAGKGGEEGAGREIRWGMVLAGIEGRLREIINDSIVLPHMDDIPFFDTSTLSQRGGVFADAFPSTTSPPAAAAERKEDLKPPVELRRTRSAEGLVHAEGGGIKPGPPEAEPDVEVLRAESIALEVSAGRRASVRKRRTWFGGGSSGGDDAGEEGEHRRGQSEDGLVVVQDNEEDVPPSPPPSAGLSRSAPSSTPSTPSPTPTSTSFLASLKSRGAGMAEKQPALKEAMRKWGGTWAAALQKSREREAGAKDRARSREAERERDRADHGDVWAGAGEGSARGSYADLRRKVEQRERARTTREGSGSGSDGNGNANGGAQPIDIPGARVHTNEQSPAYLERRTSSIASSRRTASGSGSDSSPRVSPPGSASSQFLTPSAPRTTTELHTALRPPSPSPLSTRSLPSASASASTSTSPSASQPEPPSPSPSAANPPPTDLVPPTPTPPRPPAAPIRAQPKAATMTIPGIHARHRGDVMGFGSVPPPSPPAPTPTSDAGKMQSVYRLLRGGEEAGRVPPPLPPRPVPLSEPAASEGVEPPVPAVSPASQALKNLAEQDAARSSTREGVEQGSGWKPPLPPRPKKEGSGDSGSS